MELGCLTTDYSPTKQNLNTKMNLVLNPTKRRRLTEQHLQNPIENHKTEIIISDDDLGSCNMIIDSNDDYVDNNKRFNNNDDYMDNNKQRQVSPFYSNSIVSTKSSTNNLNYCGYNSVVSKLSLLSNSQTVKCTFEIEKKAGFLNFKINKDTLNYFYQSLFKRNLMRDLCVLKPSISIFTNFMTTSVADLLFYRYSRCKQFYKSNLKCLQHVKLDINKVESSWEKYLFPQELLVNQLVVIYNNICNKEELDIDNNQKGATKIETCLLRQYENDSDEIDYCSTQYNNNFDKIVNCSTEYENINSNLVQIGSCLTKYENVENNDNFGKIDSCSTLDQYENENNINFSKIESDLRKYVNENNNNFAKIESCSKPYENNDNFAKIGSCWTNNAFENNDNFGKIDSCSKSYVNENNNNFGKIESCSKPYGNENNNNFSLNIPYNEQNQNLMSSKLNYNSNKKPHFGSNHNSPTVLNYNNRQIIDYSDFHSDDVNNTDSFINFGDHPQNYTHGKRKSHSDFCDNNFNFYEPPAKRNNAKSWPWQSNNFYEPPEKHNNAKSSCQPNNFYEPPEKRNNAKSSCQSHNFYEPPEKHNNAKSCQPNNFYEPPEKHNNAFCQSNNFYEPPAKTNLSSKQSIDLNELSDNTDPNWQSHIAEQSAERFRIVTNQWRTGSNLLDPHRDLTRRRFHTAIRRFHTSAVEDREPRIVPCVTFYADRVRSLIKTRAQISSHGDSLMNHLYAQFNSYEQRGLVMKELERVKEQLRITDASLGKLQRLRDELEMFYMPYGRAGQSMSRYHMFEADEKVNLLERMMGFYRNA